MSGVSKRDLEAFEKEWKHRITTLEGRVQLVRDGVGSIAAGVAQNLASVKANIDSNGDALEQFDIFNQIWAKMFMKMSELIAQTDYLHAGGLQVVDLKERDLAYIKEHAKDWFENSFNVAKAEVKEEREAYIKELRTKAVEFQKAQEEAKKEEAVAESTLRGAEQILSTPGGQGSEIPEGAEVFGG